MVRKCHKKIILLNIKNISKLDPVPSKIGPDPQHCFPPTQEEKLYEQALIYTH